MFLMRILPSPLIDKYGSNMNTCRRLDQTEENYHAMSMIFETNAYVVWGLVNVGFFFFFFSLRDGVKPKPGKTTNL